jgi:rhomboid protease GluP
MDELNPPGESELAAIPARSERQAMDWSLVLASQEIPTAIIRLGHNWALAVDPRDRGRALHAIQQYQWENRHKRPWREQITSSLDPFHGGAFWWSLFLAGFYAWVELRFPAFRTVGMMDNLAVGAGEWWRLFTPILLHADLAHLMANLTMGFLLLGFAMAHYGAASALLAAYLAGAAGNLAGFFLYPQPYLGVGASGMVMGALGLIAIHSFSYWRQHHLPVIAVVRASLAGMMLFVLLGLDPATDVIAHLGGFAAGMMLGFALSFLPHEKMVHPASQTLCWVLLTMLFSSTFLLAIQKLQPFTP